MRTLEFKEFDYDDIYSEDDFLKALDSLGMFAWDFLSETGIGGDVIAFKIGWKCPTCGQVYPKYKGRFWKSDTILISQEPRVITSTGSGHISLIPSF